MQVWLKYEDLDEDERDEIYELVDYHGYQFQNMSFLAFSDDWCLVDLD